jgi:hypothetical protein
VKYQVLSDQTAFVGVVKQKDKASGQMKESTVEFGKSVKQVVDQLKSMMAKSKEANQKATLDQIIKAQHTSGYWP